MEPIINPWLVYSVSLVDKLGTWSFLLFCGCMAVWFFFLAGNSEIYDSDGQVYSPIKRFAKYLLVATILTFVLHLVIPDKDSYIAMIMASYVTPDTINGATNFTAEQLDKILKVIVDNINNVK